MDDITASADTREEAQTRMKEMDEILVANGFKIKEWIQSGKSQRSYEVKVNSDQAQVRLMMGMKDVDEEAESVLGMK